MIIKMIEHSVAKSEIILKTVLLNDIIEDLIRFWLDSFNKSLRVLWGLVYWGLIGYQKILLSETDSLEV